MPLNTVEKTETHVIQKVVTIDGKFVRYQVAMLPVILDHRRVTEFKTLEDARKFCNIEITHPVKITQPKDAYAQTRKGYKPMGVKAAGGKR